MKKYYLVEDGKQTGPYSIDEIATKNISGETLVWCEGMENWTIADEVIDLRTNKIIPPPIPSQITVKDKVSNEEDSHESKSAILRAIIIILALCSCVVITWLLVANKNNERRIQQVEVQERQQDDLRQIEIQNRQREQNAQRKADRIKRIRQLKSERAKLVALISDVESRIKEAKEIHLFRTRKEKNAEINALMAEFDNYFSRLSISICLVKYF